MKTMISMAGLLLLAAGAGAQEQGHLNVRTVVQKEQVSVDDDGTIERSLVAADTVVPGENVVYTITFVNVGDEPADSIVITNPIADSLTYIEGTAFGPGTDIQFSADGGQTFAGREELSVTENGVVREATPEDFTHIRWVMQQELAAGAQRLARFSAVLE